jgi:DEAD/DEAH box helicase
MPHSSRRPRVPSDRYGRGAERGTQRRGRAPAKYPRAPQAPRVAPQSQLDLALDAAAAAPQPTPATFAELGLDARLVSALATQDIHEPFAIQARALPDALAGRDILGRAQTGSGKTLAFGLPLLTRLAASADRKREKTPRGLVLVPTRELAQQVAEVLEPLGRRMNVSITTVYGGVPIGKQIAKARYADVVVATPGRLIDLMERHACTLSGIEVTVLDEADHMADLGFLPAVTRILDATPAGGQRMFFSATLDRGVGQLVTSYVSDPALHAVTAATDSGPAEHRVLVLSAADKVPVAAEIAGRPGRTLFFVRTKHGADRLAKQLSRAGVEAAAILASSSPPTSRRGVSTSMTSTSWCNSTRPTTTRTTCIAPAARPGPGPPAWSSPWWSVARSANSRSCTTPPGSPRPATRSRPGITWSARSRPRVRRFRRRRPFIRSPLAATQLRLATQGTAAVRPAPRPPAVTVTPGAPPIRVAAPRTPTGPRALTGPRAQARPRTPRNRPERTRSTV